MDVTTRISALSFDARSHRFEALVSLIARDGSEQAVRAAVIGSPRWPFERIVRELVGAARLQSAA